jgi:hypothetical protein
MTAGDVPIGLGRTAMLRGAQQPPPIRIADVPGKIVAEENTGGGRGACASASSDVPMCMGKHYMGQDEVCFTCPKCKGAVSAQKLNFDLVNLETCKTCPMCKALTASRLWTCSCRQRWYACAEHKWDTRRQQFDAGRAGVKRAHLNENFNLQRNVQTKFTPAEAIQRATVVKRAAGQDGVSAACWQSIRQKFRKLGN